MDYPLRTTDQLGQHLKSLRKARGFTQTQLGKLIGVGQTRVGEIEANPGLVSLDQVVDVLRALGVELVLRTDITNVVKEAMPDYRSGPARPANDVLANAASLLGVEKADLLAAIQAAKEASQGRDLGVDARRRLQPGEFPADEASSAKAKKVVELLTVLEPDVSPELFQAAVQGLFAKGASALHRQGNRGSW